MCVVSILFNYIPSFTATPSSRLPTIRRGLFVGSGNGSKLISVSLPQVTCEFRQNYWIIVLISSPNWLLAPPITSVSLRLSDKMIRVAVGYLLGLRTCESQTCPRGKDVDARGLHGLSCRRNSARQQRHAQLDVLWRAIKRAHIPVAKEPVGLSRTDGKRPDGATFMPWSRGKSLTWDVTVPDTFTESHLKDTAVLARSCSKSGSNFQDHQIHVLNNNTHLFL